MADSRERFISTATRSFEGNAEMEVSAAKWLEEHLRADERALEAAAARWDKVDANQHRKAWRWIAPSIALLVSAIVLIHDGKDTYWHFLWGRSLTREHTDAPAGTKDRVSRYLTPGQRLLIPPGMTEGSPADLTRGLWESEPGNAAYFSEHSVSFNLENRKLPPDFLATARKLEPDNAWFLYLAAAVEGRNAFAPKAGSWEVKDAARMDRALELLREAGTLGNFESHTAAMLRKRLEILRHGTFPERMDTIHVLASAPISPTMALYPISGIISTQANVAADAGDADAYRKISKDAEAHLRHLMRPEVATLLGETLNWGMAAALSNQLAQTADKLALADELALWKGISTRLKESRKARRISGLDPDETVDPSLPLLASTMRGIAGVSTMNPPPLPIGRLQPLASMEHSELMRFAACAGWGLMVLCTVATAIYPFRASRLYRGLARREADLLDGVDGLWIAGVGVLLPFVYVLAVNFLTPLGGRHLSLGSTAFLLPAAHAAGLWLLWLTVTPQVVRWRLAERAGVMGYPGSPWPGRVACAAAIALIPVIGWAAIAGSHIPWWEEVLTRLQLPFVPAAGSHALFWTAAGLFGIALLITLVRAAAALFVRLGKLPHACAFAMALTSAYAGAVALSAAGVSASKANARYWFERDTVTKTSATIPSWSAYEYEVAVQSRKELREVLKFGAEAGRAAE